MENLKIYEVVINDDNELQGLIANSLVQNPAIKENFLFFSDENYENINFSIDEYEKEIFGPVFIPDKPILRINKETNEKFYIKFSKETIKKIAIKFFKNDNINNLTINHLFPSEKAIFFESIIIDKKKKIYSDYYSDGTLLFGYKIIDDELWNDIVNKKIKGFSGELNCELKLQNEEKITEIENILNII
jgi:hypothetical protein